MAADILKEIVAWTETDVLRRMSEAPMCEVVAQAKDMPKALDFAGELRRDGLGLIAEIKVKSPSLGLMRPENVQDAPGVYSAHPLVRAVSVLTCEKYFGMGLSHLRKLRWQIDKPILRKDFILGEYQIAEARGAGADAVLLMSNVLSVAKLNKLLEYCHSLGMEALVETHSRKEIDHLPSHARVVGVNSRKMDSSKVMGISFRYAMSRILKKDWSAIPTKFELFKHLPKRSVKVAESGIRPSTIASIKRQGWNSALIGASLLKDQRGIAAALDEMQQALEGKQVFQVQENVAQQPHFA